MCTGRTHGKLFLLALIISKRHEGIGLIRLSMLRAFNPEPRVRKAA